MAVLIVLPELLNSEQIGRLWDDILEAMEYEKQHPETTVRCVLTRWDHKNNLPVYEKLPEEQTYIEWITEERKAVR